MFSTTYGECALILKCESRHLKSGAGGFTVLPPLRPRSLRASPTPVRSAARTHMPAAPSRPCSKPGCINLNCTEHSASKSYDQARRRARHSDPERAPGLGRYNTTRWRQVREIVLARDLICVVCREEAANEADHIVAIARGGEVWDLSNLQGLCASCHSKKTRREGATGVGPSLPTSRRAWSR